MAKAVKLKAKDSKALKEFLRELRSRLGEKLIEVKLFGSKARGEDTKESDIDVLVVVSEATVQIEDSILDIAFDLNLKHEVYISPRVVDPAILSDPVWKITPFLQNISREGIPL
jgi:predicted nucleotidyltransferase